MKGTKCSSLEEAGVKGNLLAEAQSGAGRTEILGAGVCCGSGETAKNELQDGSGFIHSFIHPSNHEAGIS